MSKMEAVLTNYTMYQMTRAEEILSGGEMSLSNTTGAIFRDNLTRYDERFEPVWVWTIIDGLLMIFILCGNTLTILAVTLSRRLSNLISNKFVLNLAISDLSVGLTLPYHLAFYLDDDLGSMKTTCVLRFILITLACCASILNLILIAVDRYVAILHPLHYSRYMSKMATGTLMGVGWMMAVGVSVVPIFWNNWGMASSCDMHKVIPREFTTNVLAPMFSMIWVVMLVLYWRIWREAALHTKRMRTATYLQSGGPNDWKSIQVVLMVLGSFSICWMPYVAVICTQAVTSPTNNNAVLYKAVFSLAMANSGVNPLIYAWKNTGFRRAFLRLLRCQSPDCPEFGRSFRNTTAHASAERKLPLETISRQERPAVEETAATEGAIQNGTNVQHKDANARDRTLGINNNSVTSDRCRIIENAGFEAGMSDSISGCHIIENLGFEDTLDRNSMKMIDSSSKDSDGDSVATLPIGHTETHNVKVQDVNKRKYFV